MNGTTLKNTRAIYFYCTCAVPGVTDCFCNVFSGLLTCEIYLHDRLSSEFSVGPDKINNFCLLVLSLKSA